MSAPAIYVDADACPVKAEVYRVAERYLLKVYVVSNALIALPRNPLFERVIVGDGFDAADDWIAERVGPTSIVITADIPLASRCLAAGAMAIGSTGKPWALRWWMYSSIGSAPCRSYDLHKVTAATPLISGSSAASWSRNSSSESPSPYCCSAGKTLTASGWAIGPAGSCSAATARKLLCSSAVVSRMR